MINYAAADTLMGIFGYKRMAHCPHCKKKLTIVATPKQLKCAKCKKVVGKRSL